MLGLRFAISLSKKAEKYSASTCISTRKNDIHNSFEKHMIEELRTLIAGEESTNVMDVKWIIPVKNNMNCVYSKLDKSIQICS